MPEWLLGELGLPSAMEERERAETLQNNEKVKLELCSAFRRLAAIV